MMPPLPLSQFINTDEWNANVHSRKQVAQQRSEIAAAKQKSEEEAAIAAAEAKRKAELDATLGVCFLYTYMICFSLSVPYSM